jgi:hypothetical protein
VIARGIPIVFPDYDREGNQASWKGRLPRFADIAQLPVAYFAEGLRAMGATIAYEPPSPVAAGQPFRVPRYVFGGPPNLFTEMPDDQRSQLDALGVMHITSIPFDVTIAGSRSSLFQGFPPSGEILVPEAPELRQSMPPDRYIGGQALVLSGLIAGIVGLVMSDAIYEEIERQVPIGSDATCQAINPELLAGETSLTILQTSPFPTRYEFVRNTDQFQAQADEYAQHCLRYGRFAAVVWDVNFQSSIQDFFWENPKIVCKGPDLLGSSPTGFVNDVFDDNSGDTPPQYAGNDSAYWQQVEAEVRQAEAAFRALVPPEYLLDIGPFTLDSLRARIVEFFTSGG